MAAVALQLLTDVVALSEPRNGKGAVGRSRISAYHGAAAAADLAAQVFQLEAAAGDPGPGHAVLLVDHQGRQGDVGDSDGLIFAALDIDLRNRVLRELVAGGRLGLFDGQPAVLDALQDDLARLIRLEGAQVPLLPGLRLVAGPGDVELGVLDGVMGDGVFLLDGDGGPLVVFKIHIPVPVRVKRDQLRVGIREVGRRHRLFRDLVHAGQQVLHRGGAVRPGGHFGHAMAVLPLDQKHRAGDWRAGVGVALVDGQVGTLVILQADGGVLAWEQLHMVLRGVQDMVRHGGHLLQGVHPRLQALPADRAIRPGGAVQVPGAILNFGQPVGDAAQGCTVRALLMQIQGG